MVTSAITLFSLQEFLVDKVRVKTGSVISVFASGDYKLIFYLSSRTEQFGAINVIAKVTSPDRNSFG